MSPSTFVTLYNLVEPKDFEESTIPPVNTNYIHCIYVVNNESFYYFRTTTKLRSDDTAGFMRLSVLHYHLGEAEESLNEVRECLRLDPDHKDCFTLYKKLKKVAKFVVAAREARNSEEWDDCKDAANKVRVL